MHLGLLIYGDLETVSGGYLYDRKLIETLHGCGDTVEVVSLPPRRYTRCLADNFDRGLRLRLQTGGWDILLQDELNHPSLFILNRRIRPHLGCPIVSIVHHLRGSEDHPAGRLRFYRWIERRYLHSVDAFIFNSHTTRQSVQAAGGRAACLPWVVAEPAGDELEIQITPAGIAARAHQTGPLRVLFIGNLIPRKGLHILLDALEQLPPGQCRLTVIGDPAVNPEYASDLRGRTDRSRLAQIVSWRGKVERAELQQALADHHLLAVPSSYEGFGIVYLEGMAAGLPAIATTAGAASEIITPGQDGFLLPPGDAAALAHTLRELAKDRARLAKMGVAALERFQNHSTWLQSGQRAREFLCILTGDRHAPA